MSSNNDNKIVTSIGGQALMEAIMMRGPHKTMIAGRLPNGEIYKEEMKITTLRQKYAFFRLPLVRGICAMIESLTIGYKALMISADKCLEEDETESSNEETSKFEQWLDRVFGEKLMNILMIFASIIGVAIALLLFFVLPVWLFNFASSYLDFLNNSIVYRSVFEGILRIILFVVYILLVSQTKDIKKTFKYHGAEHKTIFCYENNEELTIENVKKYKRFHPRCGTSFMIIMLILGIFIGVFIPFSNPFLRGGIKILCLPIIMGIGFEIIKFSGRHSNNFIVKIISAPGMWMQRITTKEPDDDMIECAIVAMKEVIPENGEDRIK